MSEEIKTIIRRHKLGFSYAGLSRWPGWHKDWDKPLSGESPVLMEGRSHLIADYLMGKEGVYNSALQAFDRALSEARDRGAVLYWLARLYAHHGYFIEASDALEQMAVLDHFCPRKNVCMAKYVGGGTTTITSAGYYELGQGGQVSKEQDEECGFSSSKT